MDYSLYFLYVSINILAINGFQNDGDDDDPWHDHRHKHVGREINIYYYIIPIIFVLAGLTIIACYCCKKSRSDQHHPQCPRRTCKSRFCPAEVYVHQNPSNFCPVCQVDFPEVDVTYGTINPRPMAPPVPPDYNSIYSTESSANNYPSK